MKKTIFDLVLELLRKKQELRSSDPKLQWEVWRWQGLAGTTITEEDFIKRAISSESVTRARRKAQELHPELHATQEVKKARKIKQEQKGELIFDEVRQVYKYC